MNLTRNETIMLSEIRKKVEKELKNNEYYKRLVNRKEEIINYLCAMKNRKDDGNLLRRYDRLGEQIKEMEFQKAFEITNNDDDNNHKMNIVDKLFKRRREKVRNKKEIKYNDEFDTIIEDTNYKAKIKKRKEIFNKLSRNSKKYKEMLYELESLETEMATIETEKIRAYINNI